MESVLQDQYQFVYDTLLEYTRGIDSRFPISELANKIKEKTIKDKKSKKNAYATEYGVREQIRECRVLFRSVSSVDGRRTDRRKTTNTEHRRHSFGPFLSCFLPVPFFRAAKKLSYIFT